MSTLVNTRVFCNPNVLMRLKRFSCTFHMQNIIISNKILPYVQATKRKPTPTLMTVLVLRKAYRFFESFSLRVSAICHIRTYR
jgi:hypothetical protein